MAFDFTSNRIIFGLGMVTLFVLTSVLITVYDANIFTIILVALLFVIVMNYLMRRVANNNYRYVHQLLFIYADAEGYLNNMKKLYQRGSRRHQKAIAIKTQNYCMATVFAGGFDEAKEMNDHFKAQFNEALEHDQSMRFSQGLIDAMIHLFQYDASAFEEAHQRVMTEIEALDPQTREYVENNPYSIYYMIKETGNIMIESTIDVEKLEEDLKDANEFLKSCVLYALFKHQKIEASEVSRFEKAAGNTMFFLDQDKIY